jgi:hypothetical protein
VRRLVDRDGRTVSLRRLIEQLRQYPELLQGNISLRDLKCDVSELDDTCKKVKDYVDQFVAHHDRNGSIPVPTHRELNEAIDMLIAKFKKYHVVLFHFDTEVVVRYLDNPLSIFSFAWIDATRT